MKKGIKIGLGVGIALLVLALIFGVFKLRGSASASGSAGGIPAAVIPASK